MIIDCIVKNLGSSGAKNPPSAKVGGGIATTLLSRDYKGFSNYGSNAVIVMEADDE